jgi:hypothetical protein
MLKTFAFGFVAAVAGVAIRKFYQDGTLEKVGGQLRERGRKLVEQGSPILEKVAGAARSRSGLKLAPSPSVSKRPPAAPWPADARALPN